MARASAQNRVRPDTAALYAQIPRVEAEKLDRAAFELKTPKRDLIAALVAGYVDPHTPEGLEQLRALSEQVGESEVPLPPRPERRAPARAPAISVSRASDWVAGMQRAIRAFAKSLDPPEPLVRVTLESDEHVFLQQVTPGPGDDFVTLTVYEAGEDVKRVLLVRLEAIRKVEILGKPPTAAERAFAFRPRGTGVGFASGS